MWFKRRQTPERVAQPQPPDPAEVIRGLRQQALTLEASQLGVAPTRERPHVWGVLMETGFPEAVVSLVAFADGTTSLYFSNGGGVIGAGEHESVRVASAALLGAAEAHVAGFAPAGETPLPAAGRVRFYVRTFGGTLTAETDEQDLGHRRHPLAPVFHAGHAVIAAVREATERK
jgi:hypothetical protein